MERSSFLGTGEYPTFKDQNNHQLIVENDVKIKNHERGGALTDAMRPAPIDAFNVALRVRLKFRKTSFKIGEMCECSDFYQKKSFGQISRLSKL